MSDYLAKPVEPGELYQVLERWLGPAMDRVAAESPEKPRGAAGILPDSLPGLDLQEALGRLGGNRNLLRQLLLRFRGDYGQAPGEVRRWVNTGDLAQARTLVHNLKGASGALGASRVFQAATRLNAALSRENVSAEDLDGFQEAMEELLGGLNLLD